MNCTDCQNQFSDFIDDEISLQTAHSFKGHLASCPACANEWQHFQRTIHTLHNFPTQKVPADFLIGINDKLAPQPFAKLRDWFSLLNQHKLTATSVLATLVVGVISAAMFQLTPVDNNQTMAQRQQPLHKNMLQVKASDQDHINYYPGIPYLAATNEARPAPPHRSRVQFTPVKQSPPRALHNSLLDSRAPPSLAKLTGPAPSLERRFGGVTPDLVVTVHAQSSAYQHALVRQLTSHHNWQTQISGNTLLVSLPCNQLATFQHLFGPVDPHLNHKELLRLRKSAGNILTVAVAFH